MSVAVDSPDFQFGVVNAQKLLATVPGGTGTVQLGVPPNCETLVVIFNSSISGLQVTARGNTTLTYYPLAISYQNQSHGSFVAWVDVSSVLSEDITVVVGPTPSADWFVYADAGVHLTTDPTKLTNGRGQQYVIPSVPSQYAADHPPVELQFASLSITANWTFIGAPGAGKRLRVFGAWMTSAASGVVGSLQDGGTSTRLLACATPASVTMPIPLTGLALSENSALNYILESGAGGVVMGAYYTTEDV